MKKRHRCFLVLFFEEWHGSGFQRPQAFGSLSFAISLWNDKGMACKSNRERAQQCERPQKRVLKRIFTQ